MPAEERFTATVSTEGRVVLPKAIRERLGWEAGTRSWSWKTHPVACC